MAREILYNSSHTGEIIDEIVPKSKTKAPNKHSSTTGQYGLATSSKYGHAKIVSDVSDTLDKDSGTVLSAETMINYLNNVGGSEILQPTEDSTPTAIHLQTQNPTTYNDGESIVGYIDVDCGDNPTIKIDSFGPYPIINLDGSPLQEGNIVAGSYFTLTFCIPLYKWVLNGTSAPNKQESGDATITSEDMIQDNSIPSNKLANTGITAGQYDYVTVNAKGQAISGRLVSSTEELGVYDLDYINSTMNRLSKSIYTFKGWVAPEDPSEFTMPDNIPVGALWITGSGIPGINITPKFSWDGSSWINWVGGIYLPDIFDVLQIVDETIIPIKYTEIYYLANQWNVMDSSTVDLTQYRTAVLQDVIDATLIEKTGGNAGNTVIDYTLASSRTTLVSGTTLSTLIGNIGKWFSDLKAGAFSSNIGTPYGLVQLNELGMIPTEYLPSNITIGLSSATIDSITTTPWSTITTTDTMSQIIGKIVDWFNNLGTASSRNLASIEDYSNDDLITKSTFNIFLENYIDDDDLNTPNGFAKLNDDGNLDINAYQIFRVWITINDSGKYVAEDVEGITPNLRVVATRFDLDGTTNLPANVFAIESSLIAVSDTNSLRFNYIPITGVTANVPVYVMTLDDRVISDYSIS